MNQNRITNIIERGGVEGWETVRITILIFTIGSRLGSLEEIIWIHIFRVGSAFRVESGKVRSVEWSSSWMVSYQWWQDCWSYFDISLRRQQSDPLRLPASPAHEPRLQNHRERIQTVPLPITHHLGLSLRVPGLLRSAGYGGWVLDCVVQLPTWAQCRWS